MFHGILKAEYCRKQHKRKQSFSQHISCHCNQMRAECHEKSCDDCSPPGQETDTEKKGQENRQAAENRLCINQYRIKCLLIACKKTQCYQQRISGRTERVRRRIRGIFLRKSAVMRQIISVNKIFTGILDNRNRI